MSRGHSIAYSAAELAWIKAHGSMPRREAHALFCETFHRNDINLDHFKSLCTRNGWTTGRTGFFPKGQAPPNKGKTMPYNVNVAKTQFKKGHRGGIAIQVYKPIGTERLSKEGYVERKIHDGLPLQSRWRAVHLINWERQHGPIPKGYCLKSIDGNKSNADLSNWKLIPRAMLPFLNGHRGHNYDQAAPDAKPVILTLATLKLARSKRAVSPER